MRPILILFIFILSIQFNFSQCDYILELIDQEEDGWVDIFLDTNAFIEVNNNGIKHIISINLLEGKLNYDTITTNTGNTLTLTYYSLCGTASDCYENENSFDLKDCNNHVLWSGVGGANSSKTFTIDCSCTGLPVVYASMYYNYIAKELHWQTLSEINNDYFLIEIGSSFDSKGNLIIEETYTENGNGNTNTTSNYSYSINVEDKYVKLSQVDYDNTIKVLELKHFSSKQEPNNNIIKVYPNPAIAHSVININGEYINIEIFNFLGEKLNAKTINNQILGLDKGIYIIKTDNNSTKLIVL